MEKLRAASGKKPSLLIVDATEQDPANQIYIKKKVEDFNNLGWPVEVVKPADTSELVGFVSGIKAPPYDCLIVQMPLAKQFQDFNLEWIHPSVDCDGLTKNARVIPATTRGIIDYLNACQFKYNGRKAVVIGRSNIVGKPTAQALLDKNMTVTVCHSHTPAEDLTRYCQDADLVVAAAGVPHLLHRAQCPHAFVVDVGINRVNGKLIGDFEEDPALIGEGVSLRTPVPGGVGLLTRLGLMKNCYELTNIKEF